MIFDSFADIGTVLAKGILAYLSLIVLLRVTGKRTLSKMNSFDFVVTIALGSIMSSTILSASVSVTEGLAAFLVLVLGQFAITWATTHRPSLQRFTKAEPSLLVRDGAFLRDAMRDQRVTEPEVRSALREHGVARVEEAFAVILETNGEMSVIPKPVEAPDQALAGVKR